MRTLKPGLFEEDTGAPHTPLLRRFGDYQLLEELGRGGMGVVYKARQLSLDRIIALKVILSGHFARPEEVQRFRAEARMAANLQHPNIVAIHEVGERDGQYYFTMDYVRGRSLAALVRDSPLPAEQAARYVRVIAGAVQHAHERGTLHRDLKPSNILIDAADQPRITDFGLAKRLDDASELTTSGQAVGSPGYMPPEQALGERGAIGPPSDVYSLGALLYHLLTARAPFSAGTIQATLTQVLEREPVSPRALNPDLPRDLETICLKCLEKEPQRRYASAQELGEELECFLEGRPIQARPVGAPGHLWRWCRRNPIPAALAATIALLLLVVAVGSSVAAWRIAAARDAEARERERAEQHMAREARERRRAVETSIQLKLQHAEGLLRANKASEALAHLAGVLRQDSSNRIAAARILSVLTLHDFATPRCPPLRHEGKVFMARFNPDAERVVTASADRTVRIWDARTGELLLRPLHHTGEVRAVAISRDGARIISGSVDHTARLWDARTGEPLGQPLEHDGVVIGVEFSPDGQRVLTLSGRGVASYPTSGNTVRVWNVTNGGLLAEPLRHKSLINSAHFSPDGRRIVTASNDGTAKLWDAETGQVLATLPGGNNSVLSAELSPDGSRVVLAGFDGHARIWRLEPREQIAEMTHEMVVMHAGFSPDGSRVATASRDRMVRLWRADNGQPAQAPLPHDAWVSMTQFSPDGRRLLTTCFDNTAWVWDLASGQLLTQPLKHMSRVNDAAFSPDGDCVVTASDDQTAQIWNSRPPDRSPRSLPHRHAVWAEFGPDGSRILTWSYDQTARVWEAATGQPLTPLLKHNGMIRSGRFSPDGKRVVTASRDGTARLWDARTGQLLARVQHGSTVVDAEFSPDGVSFATASGDGTARVWNADTGEPQCPPLRHQDTVFSVCFSSDGRRVATASSDGTARLWDAATGRAITDPIRHYAPVRTARFSPDGGRIVTASANMTARVWDARTGLPLSPPFRHFGDMNWAEFSPNGRLVLTASHDRTARLWDAATGQPVGAPMRHEAEVWIARFSPDGERIATGALDKTARVWDAQSAQPITEPLRHRANVVSVSFSPDGRWLVTGQELRGKIAEEQPGKRALIWEIPQAPLPVPSWLPELAEAVAGLRVSEEGLLETVSPVRFLQLSDQLAAEHPSDGPAQPTSDPNEARLDYYERFANSWLTRHGTRTSLQSSSTFVSQAPATAPQVQTRPDWSRALGIPARDPLCSSNCIDLTRHFTAELTNDWHGIRWPGNNLAVLPQGRQIFQGIEFDVRGIVQLAGRSINVTAPGYPEEANGIVIRRRCNKLHFLHALGWGSAAPGGTPVGRYRIQYADGQIIELPIINREDSGEWTIGADVPRDLTRATVAWTGRNARDIRIQLFLRTWQNPRPDLPIESLDFVSSMTAAAPFLIALTAEP